MERRMSINQARPTIDNRALARAAYVKSERHEAFVSGIVRTCFHYCAVLDKIKIQADIGIERLIV